VSKKAVILAGGKGSRLGPYTTVLPKPLLPIGDRAILDVVVRQLRRDGFTDLTFAVGHLAHLIQAVFGEGSAHGVKIAYHHEREPLGTAGPLATIDGLDETFLLMNGDVLTTLDYDALFDAHRSAGDALTIATHRRVVKTEYGVIRTSESDGATSRVVAYEEKPEIPYVVSMGVYVAEPRVLEHIPADRHFDLPDVVLALLEAGERVGSFLFDGFWLDIGRHEDYERAIIEYEQVAALLDPDVNGAEVEGGPVLRPTQDTGATSRIA
jgi:NDP-sugar pyrophosphorylase family protein